MNWNNLDAANESGFAPAGANWGQVQIGTCGGEIGFAFTERSGFVLLRAQWFLAAPSSWEEIAPTARKKLAQRARREEQKD